MRKFFKYAPGRPGFGSRGNPGDPGRQGLSIYFTDLNPNTDRHILNSRIINNQKLWNNVLELLPDGRGYVVGDIFIDSEGFTYEIKINTLDQTINETGVNGNEEATSELRLYEAIGSRLTLGNMFIPLGVKTDVGQFERYFNNNVLSKVIIDNVHTTTSAINYTSSPENIYGITPNNFTRIEYTNVKPDGIHNAYTVYSCASTLDESNKALAIVYNDNTQTFHIGNLDRFGNLRNTNLTFDVSVLKQTKNESNSFNINTPPGTVLTNYEINANSLFDPIFNNNPESFNGNIVQEDIITAGVIYWNLRDFVDNDPDIKGDLYVYEHLTTQNNQIFGFDSSIARPLIFSNIISNRDASIRISNLNYRRLYDYYIKLHKNGWSRNTKTKSLTRSILGVTPTQLTNIASEGISFNNHFNVISNSDWTVSFNETPWIENINITRFGFDGSIGFSITQNSTEINRIAIMTIISANGSSQNISITQLGINQPPIIIPDPPPQVGPITDVFIRVEQTMHSVSEDPRHQNREDARYTIHLDNLPLDTFVNISIGHRVILIPNNTNTINFTDIDRVTFDSSIRFTRKQNNEHAESHLSENLRLGSLSASHITPIFMHNIINSESLSIESHLRASDNRMLTDISQWSLRAEYLITIKYESGPLINIINNGHIITSIIHDSFFPRLIEFI